jgi:hypothetical protein
MEVISISILGDCNNVDGASRPVDDWRRSDANLWCHLAATAIVARGLPWQLRGNLPQRLGRGAADVVGVEGKYASMLRHDVENIFRADSRYRNLR